MWCVGGVECGSGVCIVVVVVVFGECECGDEW